MDLSKYDVWYKIWATSAPKCTKNGGSCPNVPRISNPNENQISKDEEISLILRANTLIEKILKLKKKNSCAVGKPQVVKNENKSTT